MLPRCGGPGKADTPAFPSSDGWYESMSSQSLAARFRIGIDTGGTFTDIVSVDTLSGNTHVTKVASTPANPAIGLVRGVNEILAAAGATSDDVAGLAHGTTVATNALLQGEINSLGLIVNSGFKHILEIARQSVPEGYGNSYFWVKPDRIVPLQFVREVTGRLDFRGHELRPLDEATVREAARYFRAQGIRAIGICLLHSYANDAHERRAAEIVAQEYPDATLSLSCVVLPEYREYERAVTTLVDAFVKPHMDRYLKRVHQELGVGLQDKPFLVMQSSGGVASAEQVVRKPITTALSGPAAGVLGSAVVAEIAGFPDLVTLDAGGTSTDLCLIEGGKPHHRNRELEPGQCDPADDDSTRHRSPRIRIAVIWRRRTGAIGRRDGSVGHEGLHRAAQPGKPLGIRPARGRLAHGQCHSEVKPCGLLRHAVSGYAGV